MPSRIPPPSSCSQQLSTRPPSEARKPSCCHRVTARAACTDKAPSPRLSRPISQDQLQSSSRVLESTKQLLESCPTNHYLLVSQPNLNAGHLSSKAAVPKLSDSLGHAASSYSVAEIAGELDMKSIATYIREKCELPRSAVDVIELSPVPSSAADSAQTLKDNGERSRLISLTLSTQALSSPDTLPETHRVWDVGIAGFGPSCSLVADT